MEGGSTAFSFPFSCRGRGEKKSAGNGRLDGRAMELRDNLRMDCLDMMAAANGSTMGTEPDTRFCNAHKRLVTEMSRRRTRRWT